ncbi:hypothetical protein [Pseudomonas syringae]|uniref:hypothetical protein n=1 Tax=Pseudomonas syringae TaxID=317 RepID=UPI001F29A742|nr:hypothetical protein [Pseudomonas syringae]MCF5372021.1 hypothetical protein [Pseudomonas syringae]
MTIMKEQVQLAIDSFEMTLVTGSVKTMMHKIKAQYGGVADTQETLKYNLKGAGGSSDLWNVPYQELQVLEGFNVRLPSPELDAHIEFLTNSILKTGFMRHKPLAALVLEVNGTVGLFMFDGHCRLDGVKAAVALGAPIEMVPVVVIDGRNINLDDLWVQMHRGNKGLEHTPFEVGLLCKRLANNGHSDVSIGERMGIKPYYVDGLMRLVNSPKPLVDAVLTNELSATEAIKMIRTHGAGRVVNELEYRRTRALAEAETKAPAAVSESNTTKAVEVITEQPAATPARPRLTARHASNAHSKKVVLKHGMELFQTARALKADPAYDALSVTTRLALEALLLHLEAAEKADRLPLEAKHTQEGDIDQQAA